MYGNNVVKTDKIKTHLNPLLQVPRRPPSSRSSPLIGPLKRDNSSASSVCS
jgi:hypothetical protein